MATKRRKLYFDVNLTVATKAIFACTESRAGYSGDRYGGVLDDLPTLTTASANEAKRRNEVFATFVPLTSNAATTTVRNPLVSVGFNAWTTGVATGFYDPTPSINGGQPGQSSVTRRHFAVHLAKAGAATLRGTLIVQRQHSIEV
jgi:hypothetical protein